MTKWELHTVEIPVTEDGIGWEQTVVVNRKPTTRAAVVSKLVEDGWEPFACTPIQSVTQVPGRPRTTTSSTTMILLLLKRPRQTE